jgi:hypothetical protein
VALNALQGQQQHSLAQVGRKRRSRNSCLSIVPEYGTDCYSASEASNTAMHQADTEHICLAVSLPSKYASLKTDLQIELLQLRKVVQQRQQRSRRA